jgi:uncharacterized ParB-like nuclease family protein
MNNSNIPTANSQGLSVPSPSQEILQLPISDIIADFETYAYRDQLNQEKVVEYQQLVDDLPPLDVFKIDDSYVLVGGFHRLEAHKQSDRELITVVAHQGSEVDAKMFACKANAQHGLNMTASERKRALMDFIRFSLAEDPYLSNVAIAQAYGGTSEASVRRYRKSLEESGGIERLTERRGADGRVRETDNIGKTTSSIDEDESLQLISLQQRLKQEIETAPPTEIMSIDDLIDNNYSKVAEVDLDQVNSVDDFVKQATSAPNLVNDWGQLYSTLLRFYNQFEKIKREWDMPELGGNFATLAVTMFNTERKWSEFSHAVGMLAETFASFNAIRGDAEAEIDLLPTSAIGNGND